ncbi:MAG TPA: DUF2997 domain-containing protein [Blastocatellia bacterium]|nr:DUF2997 domain-containing protein [Blastocatellia bacterium]HMZ19588.1 DUF2997 domain-containing protein [Blastocatellia bacterium]
MPEINFTIEEQSGELELKIAGVSGAQCADVAKLVTELLGEPAREENTPEFYVRAQVRPPIQSNRSGQ